MTFERIGEWVAAFAVFAVLSLLWRENRLYRVAEHLLLGLSIGVAVVATWVELLKPRWYEPLLLSVREGDAGQIIFGGCALVLGLCWYGQYFRRTEWLTKVALGVVLGASAGQAIRNQFTQQIPVVTSSFRSPIVIDSGAVDIGASFTNSVFLVALLSVFAYFFFTVDWKGWFATGVHRVGRFWLMVGFGVFFGNTVMTRMSVLIERVWFLVVDFFGRMFIR